MIKKVPLHYGIQPTNEKWIALAKNFHKENLKSSTRFTFSGPNLNTDYLEEIIHNNKYSKFLKRIDLDAANKMNNNELQKCHFFNYNSVDDFLNKSFGFYIEKNNKILSACTACLLSKKSAEISIITDPEFRKNGLATIVAAKFILYCLKHDLIPHWDAANYPSYLLALKLGYDYVGDYNIYYLT